MPAERPRGRRAKACVIAALCLVAVAASGSPTSARGDGSVSGPRVLFAAPFSPKEVPTRHTIPIRFSLLERIRTQTGGPPPALQQLDLDLDRHLGLSVLGRPSCPRPLGGRGSRRDTLLKCEEARVGSGTAELAVAFPERNPMPTTGRISVYNGGIHDGRTVFWIYAYFPAPVTGAVLMPLEFRRDEQGPYGWSGLLKWPSIANGYASLTDFEIAIRKGVFSARCVSGRLRARALSSFADGTAVTAVSAPACRSTPS